MNPSVLVMGEIVGQSKLFNVDKATGSGEGRRKLNSNQLYSA